MHVPRIPPRAAVVAALALVALACPGPAGAEEIVMRGGAVRHGTVVEKDAEYVVVQTALGRIRIPATDIEAIRPDGGRPAPAAEPVPLPPSRGDAPPEAQPEADEPGSTADADSPLGAAERLRRLERSRVVRKLLEGAEAEAAHGAPAEATVGGLLLKEVPKGTPLIVFHPPRPFDAAPGAIELGRRVYARMGLAGRASAFVSRPGKDGDDQIALRLAEITRHVEALSPDSRIRIFEGINGGDWVRIRKVDGTVVEGRLGGVTRDEVRLVGDATEDSDGVVHVSVQDVVEVDGLLRDSAAQMALLDIQPGEPLAITFWPRGEQVLGRFMESPASLLCLDTDGDGVIDRSVSRTAPIAEVRRIPEAHRDLATKLATGAVVRLTYREEFPDATVRRTLVGSVEALTAFALSLDHGDGGTVVPFGSVTDMALIEDRPDQEIEAWRSEIGRVACELDLPVLPGASASDVAAKAEVDGISTINDGRVVTHVFVSKPYATEAFGVRLGERVAQSLRRSRLRFDTVVQPRPTGDMMRPPREYISETVEGLRVVLLVDPAGVVTSLEVGLRNE